MKVSILAVGTELLFGQTVNTNAAFLSRRLNLLGFDVMYHFVVGDNVNRLKEKLDEAFASSDIVLLTGGLGPTQDDLTKETVAEKMGADMYVDEEVRNNLDSFFAKRGMRVPETNYKQALLPVGCTPFHNAAGTAPGFALEKKGKIAICLPGPPREMKWLYENCVEEYLQQFIDKRMYYRVIRTIGIGESDLEILLMPLIDGQTDPTIATYVKEGECTLRIASQRTTQEEAEEAVNKMIDKLDQLAGEYIYSYDDEELNEVVVKLLKEKDLTLSAAESCTGGLFAATITDVPGASKVFEGSYVTYSDKFKIKNLGVSSELIECKGVSSPEVATEMALCAREKSSSDISISITGNAGPEVYEGQNAGDAFIGYSYGNVSACKTIKSRGIVDRRWNRNYFKLAMLSTVYSILKGKI